MRRPDASKSDSGPVGGRPSGVVARLFSGGMSLMPSRPLTARYVIVVARVYADVSLKLETQAPGAGSGAPDDAGRYASQLTRPLASYVGRVTWIGEARASTLPFR
jgi:hypothetical protein